MKRANTMSTITVELTIKTKTKFTSNAEKTTLLLLTHQHGPLVCFVILLFCFLFWAILIITHKMSSIPLLCVVFVLFLLWLCVFCLFLLVVFGLLSCLFSCWDSF